MAPQGKVIVLNVVDFDIEQHSACEFDYLQIFDGSKADNATLLGRFCGEKKPGIFTSTFNHMHIEFASDNSVFGRGFKANYTFVDIECGGLIKDSKEIVKPPMDTATDIYKPNLKCRWLIQAPEGYVIQMNIINFDLELDTQCKYDYIKIFNNGSGNGDQIGPFCGTNAPKVITTIDNLATILFVTDSSTSKDGFTITFNFIESSKCKWIYLC
jgi:cubilin